MTLLEIINIFNTVATRQPNINCVLLTGDVYDLNTDNQTQRFAAFCIQQGEHYREGDFMNFKLQLFYVDRLTDDRTNRLYVQSTAINVLNNIISAVEDLNNGVLGIEATTNFDTFTQRFEAECAGAYATVTIKVPVSYLCTSIAPIYGDFEPLSFNGDYWIRKNDI